MGKLDEIDKLETSMKIQPVVFDDLAPVPRISTGIPEMDVMLKGGWPCGRCCELYALEGVGKTAIVYSTLREVQLLFKTTGKIGVLFDLEHKYHPLYAKQFYGIESPMVDPATKKVIRTGVRIYSPTVAEDALNMAVKLVDTGKVAFLAIDSMPALVPKAEYDGEVGKSYRQQQAKLVTQAFRLLVARAHKHGTILVFVNQLRIVGYVTTAAGTFPKYETPGAMSIRFLCSLRVWAGRKGFLTKSSTDKTKTGHKLGLRVDKDQNGGCFSRAALTTFYYDRGFCRITPIIEKAILHGLITRTKAGGWLKYEEHSLGQGVSKALIWFKDTLNAAYVAEIKEKLNGIEDYEPEEFPEPSVDDDDGEF